eukprot:853110-Amphidinium_carterae.1
MQGSDTNNDEKTTHRSAEETDEKGIHVFTAAQKTTDHCLGALSSLKDELCQMILKKGIPRHYTRTNVSLFGPPR